MVRLRVVVRVIPEAEYLSSFDSPSSLRLRGEEKFLYVVGEADLREWYIGTLANKIKERIELRYAQRNFGRIKYLKDDKGDCDLDLEDSVYDLLVDEGTANATPADQNATIKVICEQGKERAMREGSVVPDLTPMHYQARPRPPVPKFPPLLSTLGKRAGGLSSDQGSSASEDFDSKRPRLAEIKETQEDVVTSIEQDWSPSAKRLSRDRNSPVLVGSSQDPRRSRSGGNQTNGNGFTVTAEASKSELPNARASSNSVPSGDVVEILPDSPDPDHVRSTNHASSAFENDEARSHYQPLVTPPTDLSTNDRHKTRTTRLNQTRHGQNSPTTTSSASSSKFRTHPGISKFQEEPLSDIDDSQMSPRSKKTTSKLVTRQGSVSKRTATRESPPRNESYQVPAQSSLIDRIKPGSASSHPLAGEGRDTGGREPTTSSISRFRHESDNNNTDSMEIDSDKENQRVSRGNTNLNVSHVLDSVLPEAVPTISSAKAPSMLSQHSDRLLSQDQSTQRTPKKRKRPKGRRLMEISTVDANKSEHNGDAKSNISPFPPTETTAGKHVVARNNRSRNTTPALDSPGEQLSQTLQASALKSSTYSASGQRASEHFDDSPPVIQKTKAKRRAKNPSGKIENRSISSVTSPPEAITVQVSATTQAQPAADTSVKLSGVSPATGDRPSLGTASIRRKKREQSTKSKSIGSKTRKEPTPLTEIPAMANVQETGASVDRVASPTLAKRGSVLEMDQEKDKIGSPRRTASPTPVLPVGMTVEEYEARKAAKSGEKSNNRSGPTPTREELQKNNERRLKSDSAAKDSDSSEVTSKIPKVRITKKKSTARKQTIEIGHDASVHPEKTDKVHVNSVSKLQANGDKNDAPIQTVLLAQAPSMIKASTVTQASPKSLPAPKKTSTSKVPAATSSVKTPAKAVVSKVKGTTGVLHNPTTPNGLPPPPAYSANAQIKKLKAEIAIRAASSLPSSSGVSTPVGRNLKFMLRRDSDDDDDDDDTESNSDDEFAPQRVPATAKFNFAGSRPDPTIRDRSPSSDGEDSEDD